METIIVAAIILGAGFWFVRWLRNNAKGKGGCGCGCNSCSTAGDCPGASEKAE